ncbi:MAG: LptE family protein [Chitinophagaceae bacterium]|nr:LptE family protein [Chitinophagaceae bacterium]
MFSKKTKLLLILFAGIFLFGSCKIYRFRDVSIPAEVKTVRVQYIENRAPYVNPQLSPQLTDRLRQKINNQTRLTQIQGDEADYDIRAEVTGYNVTTSGVSDQQASTNRLIVTVNVIFKNRLDDTKSFEAPVSRNFDFSASLSLEQAQAQLLPTILQNMVDEIFNRIFSNW